MMPIHFIHMYIHTLSFEFSNLAQQKELKRSECIVNPVHSQYAFLCVEHLGTSGRNLMRQASKDNLSLRAL
jgi:hypothetical protein